MPARAARRNRICRTASSLNRRSSTRPPLLTFLNTGPVFIAALSSQRRSARTWQVASWRPNTIMISAPSPSLSVLDFSSSSVTPSSDRVRRETSSATSSERRSAPAKPTSSSARSRSPARPGSQTRLSFFNSLVVSAAARRPRLPWVRPIPRRVSRIAGCLVSSG